MKLGLHQSARLEQRLIQSPQMIQAMQVLALPTAELSERIDQELLENPFLEVQEPAGSDVDGDGDSDHRRSESSLEGAAHEGAALESGASSMLDFFERIEGDFGDGSRSRGPLNTEESDRKYEAMMNAPEGAQSFAEALLDQTSTLELTERERIVLEYVVWSLDERGYLTETPSTLAAELTLEVQRTLGGATPEELSGAVFVEEDPEEDAADEVFAIDESSRNSASVEVTSSNGLPAVIFEDDELEEEDETDDPEPVDPEPFVYTPSFIGPRMPWEMRSRVTADDLEGDDLVVTENEVRDALERLREAVHPALGALDLSECLLLQLPGKRLWTPFMRQLVTNHLDDVRSNRLPQIAKATGEDIESVKAAIEILQDLDPAPGAGFGEATAEVIHPEVMVEFEDDEVVIKIDRERTPPLRMNPIYQTKKFRKMLKEGSKEEREWAKKRLASASWFIDAILLRESTLRRISKSLFEHQRGFLERGIEALKPLRMQEIADEIGVHISTVSRGVAGKYAQTPRGIFPLKYFFTGGTTKTTGEATARDSVKARIQKIVANEDPRKPLSDEGIGKVLEERDGIKIARRTVTKYRKALEIPSSTQRKQY